MTPPKLLSTTNAVIFSFTTPVDGSVTGVLANTVKMSARPPLLWKKEGSQGVEDSSVAWNRVEVKRRGEVGGRLPDPNLASIEGVIFSTGTGHS